MHLCKHSSTDKQSEAFDSLVLMNCSVKPCTDKQKISSDRYFSHRLRGCFHLQKRANKFPLPARVGVNAALRSPRPVSQRVRRRSRRFRRVPEIYHRGR